MIPVPAPSSVVAPETARSTNRRGWSRRATGVATAPVPVAS
jgi:hypothetical protein